MILFMFLKDHPGCFVVNGFVDSKSTSWETSPSER